MVQDERLEKLNTLSQLLDARQQEEKTPKAKYWVFFFKQTLFLKAFPVSEPLRNMQKNDRMLIINLPKTQEMY